MLKLIKIMFLTLLMLPINSYSQETINQVNERSLSNEVNTDNYLNLAARFKENGEYDKTIRILTSIYHDTEDDKVKRYLGKCYCLKGDFKNAFEFINKIKEKKWYDFFYLGLIYEDLQEEAKAKESYLKAVNEKNNSVSLYRLAKIAYHNNDYQEAAKYFSQLVALDSSIRLAYYYLGNCYFRSNNLPEAYNYFSKALNFYPQNKDISEKLNIVKKELGSDFFARKDESARIKREKINLVSYRKEEGIPIVKVGIARDLQEFTFKSGEKFLISDENKIFDGQENKFYRIVLSGKSLSLYDTQAQIPCAKFINPIEIYIPQMASAKNKQQFPFYILDLVYGKGNFWQKKVDRIYRGSLRAVVRKKGMTLVNSVNIEEYLYGVLSSEIPASSGINALKAQAVAARTIAFRNINRHKNEGFDFCADVHCQVYQGMSAETPKTIKAVDKTKGEIIIFNDKPVEAFYHANCGGCLCSDTFGKRDYLVGKFDSSDGLYGGRKLSAVSLEQEEEWFYDDPQNFCGSAGNSFRWQRIYDQEDFLLSFGFPLRELKNVFFLEKGDCFHYKKIKVVTAEGESVFDNDFRIREYFDRLRSSAFKLEVKDSYEGNKQMLIFWGAGFGHGAGLCQGGAIKQAQEGITYKEILRHYYPNTQMKKAY